MAEDATIALVTGANKGIGRAIAGQLAGRGLTVLIGARDPGRGEAAAAELRADGADAHPVRLDVTDRSSVQAAAEEIGRRYGRLDVLVNNAGISGSGDRGPGEDGGQSPGRVNLDVVRTVFETNVFGVIAVTDAMLPLLRRSPAARIVNVSSGTGSLHWMTDPDFYMSKLPAVAAYPVSKTALNMLTVQYAKALAPDGIPVNAVAPGAVATDFSKNLGMVITRTPDEGARIAVQLATAAAGGPTGGFFNDDGAVPW
jgi:NAD(P)-dependent dehydrogenase (short-subunit alcohol dehydrogenase family)